jgi:hypothetical protein
LIFFVNLAPASPWLRRSWSPNYSVLVFFPLPSDDVDGVNENKEGNTKMIFRVVVDNAIRRT